MSNLKKLEIQGCRKFVCSNLSIMEEKCKAANIRYDIIERSKNMASEYFRKTYRRPHYSSARHVIPAIVYIASILEGDKKSKVYISKIFGVSYITVGKWQPDVMKVLDIEKLEREVAPKKESLDIDSQFCEIDKEGKALSLQDTTIETAKYLMSKYFKIENFGRHYSHIRRLRLAFIYIASIVENDRRTQMEMCQMSGMSECTISYWYRDIVRVLGLKIISHAGHTVTVLEGQYDS
jgi:transcription initiation factor TFIIIB Brf1 subunit/transcription initiation factor TFIIB